MSERRISKKTLRPVILKKIEEENKDNNHRVWIKCICGEDFLVNFEKCDFKYYHDYMKDYAKPREDGRYMIIEHYNIGVKCPHCKNWIDIGLVVKMDGWK